MADRIMYGQLKTGYDIDKRPSYIARVRWSCQQPGDSFGPALGRRGDVGHHVARM